jgi:small ligand-binding sensory domain FIST
MGVNALSLLIDTNKPTEALRRIGAGLSRLDKPAGVIAFASGTLASCLQSLAQGLRRDFAELPGVFASSDGVFTEQGELENQDGMACLLLGGKRLGVEVRDQAPTADLRGEGRGEMTPIAPKQQRGCPQMVLISSHLGSPSSATLRSAPSTSSRDWFGAVASSDGTIWGVGADRRTQSGAVGIVGFSGLEMPLLVGSPCCRLITEPLTVSRVEESTVLELQGVPALVALGQASSKLVDRSWIVVALTDDPSCVPTTNDGTPNLRFRPVRGVDPARGAILMTEPVGSGTKLAFAVRDDHAARRCLTDALRNNKHRLCGGAPRFGIYFDGLGRGRSLYGTANVDIGLIKQVLGEFPILGMRSAFELRGDVGLLGTQTLTGQLAVFNNPS